MYEELISGLDFLRSVTSSEIDDNDGWPTLPHINKKPIPATDLPFSGVLRLQPLHKYYQTTVDLMQMRKSLIYGGLSSGQSQYNVLPYQSKPHGFRLEAKPGVPVRIKVFRDKNSGSDIIFDVIPERASTVVEISLGLGNVWIEVRQEELLYLYTVFVSRIQSLHQGIGKALYDTAHNRSRTLLSDVQNRFGSRLVEHHLPFADLIASAKTLRTMAVRGSARTAFSHSGSELAVRDMISALTSNTAFLREATNDLYDSQNLYSSGFLHSRGMQKFGWMAYIWSPSVNARDAFNQLTHGVSQYNPLSLDRLNTILSPSGEGQVQHEFLVGDDYVERRTSDLDFRMYSESVRTSRAFFIGATYNGPITPTVCSRLSRHFQDCPSDNLDQEDLDFEEDFDPASDGWLDFDLTRNHDPYRASEPQKVHAINAPVPKPPLYGWPSRPMLSQECDFDFIEDDSIEHLISIT